MRKSSALTESGDTANNYKFPDLRKLQIVNPEVSKEQLHQSHRRYAAWEGAEEELEPLSPTSVELIDHEIRVTSLSVILC